jgi:hypothetical protein
MVATLFYLDGVHAFPEIPAHCLFILNTSLNGFSSADTQSFALQRPTQYTFSQHQV